MRPLDRSTHEELTATLPDVLREAASSAFDAFEALSMPTNAAEEWRYVAVPEGLDDLAIPDVPGAEATPSPIEGAFAAVAGRAEMVDGHVVAIDGSRVSALSEADLAGYEPASPVDRFGAAALAFGGSGVAIVAGPHETVGDPVYVSMESATPKAVTIPRVIVTAGEAASLSVVIEQRSPDGLDALVLPEVEVFAGPAARVSVTVIQAWGDAITAIGRYRHRADRGGFVELAEAGLGGRFSRLHLTVDLVGKGADARIVGAYFGDDEQTLDYRYFMNHAAPSTTSTMFLKGAVGGAARSVFTGMIRIEPEGQGTNAHQTNRNLVLSDDAQAHSVPNLEILANDVRCGHGSAVGPLDEEQRYYLMSRGLPGPRADRLQVLGFFEEALQRFPHAAVEPTLRERAMAKYDGLAS